VIVAALGHVDHGKTALVRALTGVDTDRLPEEKQRGMTIDLGFAYRRTPAGLIAFVDVPGHERFVRNMLAGVGAVEFGLLVVAADDGVMPQTREHVAIAGLLQLRRMLLVVTKVDRVDAVRADGVVAQARELLREHGLREEQVFRVSPTRGDGIPALARYLDAAAFPARPMAPGGLARFAIDRAFMLKGTGTVVTGTVVDGAIEVGDELVLSPSGQAVRVRALRMHDAHVRQARAGERCAVQLAGVSADEVERGQWIVCPALHRPTRRIDVKLHGLPGIDLPTGRSQLQLHVGTAAVTVRLLALHPAADGASFATLLAERELCVHRDDRFVLRDPARQRVIGGGRVLDPFAPVERAKAPGRIDRLRALDGESMVDVLRGLAACVGAVDQDTFAAAWRLAPSDARAAGGHAGLQLVAGRFGMTPSAIDELRGAIHAALAAHAVPAADHVMTVDALAKAVAGRLPRECFDEVLQHSAQQGTVVLRGGGARLAGGTRARDADDMRLWRRVHPKLVAAGFVPPRVDDLAQRLQVDAQSLRRMLQRKVGEGATLRLDEHRYALRDMQPKAAGIASKLARAAPDGRFTAAQFRDAIGTGRDLAIAWLECLDRSRVTLRLGDVRRVTALATGVPAAAPAAAPRRRRNWRRGHRFAGLDRNTGSAP
jgi:selenocysteine-specific elongation factor